MKATRNTSFAKEVNKFNRELDFTEKLPRDIRVLNPLKDNDEILKVSEAFYRKFYNDKGIRKMILGINPGRLGAGATGIPFTDTKRLSEICNMKIESFRTHEPSSVFIYDMIKKFGGPRKFYRKFYINSVCPLGFVEQNSKGNWVNCNYYDYNELISVLRDFIVSSLERQVSFGIDTRTCFVLGKKNAKHLSDINEKEGIFDSIVPLDHPRYIVQYKSKQKDSYINEYLDILDSR